MKKILSGFLMALLGGTVSLGLYKAFEKDEMPIQASTETGVNTKLVNFLTADPAMESNYVTAAEMSVNGVVHVKTAGTIEYSRRGFDPFREFFYGNGNYERQYSHPVRGAGSGVIISQDGYIVTNNHVIENADKIEVTLNNKKTYEADLVGRDPSTDLAVLKIEESGLPHLGYGNSDDIRIGEWVLAVGNPFNLTSTVTAGIISAKSRDINILNEADPLTGISSIESFIQTDAAVNPGNSGGALVNTKGELIGINAAIKSNTGSYAGYSFAIPSNIVKKVVGDLVEFGTIQRAFIGVNIRNIDDDLAEEEALESLDGVYVSGLMTGGSAKEAGIEEGDIIVGVDGFDISNVTELQAKVSEYRPGDQITIELLRDGENVEKTVTLKNLEGNVELVSNENVEIQQLLGAKLEEPSEEELEDLELDGGVKVTDIFPGKLAKAGVQEDFIITSVNNEAITNKKDLLDLLKDKKGGILLQGVYPNGAESYYAFGL